MRWNRTTTRGYDPAFGDPDLRAAVGHLIDGDWRFIERRFWTPHESWVLSTVLHDDQVDIPLARFEEWAAGSGSGLAVAHLGQAQISAAWKNHGEAGNITIASDRFLDGMDRAEQTLADAVRLDPTIAEPWAGLLITARALRLPFADIENRFVNVHTREPFRFDACHQMMRAMSARGGGSHDAMFEFVRWLNAEAPAEATARSLLHLAHFEYALSDAEPGLTLTDYLTLPEVAAELHRAGHSYLRATPPTAGPQHLQALNLILLMVVPNDRLSGQIVRECIHRIDDRPTALPWSAWGDDVHRRFHAVSDERLRAAELF
ncbi:MAG: hypothetical protein AAGA90_17675 [Actinomycetota bacterium]